MQTIFSIAFDSYRRRKYQPTPAHKFLLPSEYYYFLHLAKFSLASQPATFFTRKTDWPFWKNTEKEMPNKHALYLSCHQISLTSSLSLSLLQKVKIRKMSLQSVNHSKLFRAICKQVQGATKTYFLFSDFWTTHRELRNRKENIRLCENQIGIRSHL